MRGGPEHIAPPRRKFRVRAAGTPVEPRAEALAEPSRVFEEEIGALARYYAWKVEENRFILDAEEEDRFRPLEPDGEGDRSAFRPAYLAGVPVLVSGKDVIEKIFYALKNDLASPPPQPENRGGQGR